MKIADATFKVKNHAPLHDRTFMYFRE